MSSRVNEHLTADWLSLLLAEKPTPLEELLASPVSAVREFVHHKLGDVRIEKRVDEKSGVIHYDIYCRPPYNAQFIIVEVSHAPEDKSV